MTQILKQLIAMLEQLPQSIQERYGKQWIEQLVTEQGDGSIQDVALGQTHQVKYEDIKHLLGVFEGGPDDLSCNSNYQKGFGED